MTKTGYRQMWERDTVRYVTLEAIATALRVPLADLLGQEQPTTALAEPAAQYRRQYLEDRVDDLERRMQDMERKK
jgi:hypothetical protein